MYYALNQCVSNIRNSSNFQQASKIITLDMDRNIGCPTRYRTRHFFNRCSVSQQLGALQTHTTDTHYRHALQTHTTDTHYRPTLQTHNTDTHYRHKLQTHTTDTLQTRTTDTHYRHSLQTHTTDTHYRHPLQTRTTDTHTTDTNYIHALQTHTTDTHYRHTLQTHTTDTHYRHTHYRHTSTDTFLFISHTTHVLLFRCNIFIGVRIIKEIPGPVASGTFYINPYRKL